MRKSPLAALFGFLLSALLTQGTHAQLTSLTEGFDTVGSAGPPATGIFAAGWQTINNSSSVGNHNWNQGIPTGTDALGASAQSGAPNSFIQTDFQAGAPGSGAIVSDWLITPVLLLENGATMSFYTQASPSNTQFPNELQVFESQSGSSIVNVVQPRRTQGAISRLSSWILTPAQPMPARHRAAIRRPGHSLLSLSPA